MKVLTDVETTLGALKRVPSAVIGDGAQGRAQARCFHDSGLDVTGTFTREWMAAAKAEA